MAASIAVYEGSHLFCYPASPPSSSSPDSSPPPPVGGVTGSLGVLSLPSSSSVSGFFLAASKSTVVSPARSAL